MLVKTIKKIRYVFMGAALILSAGYAHMDVLASAAGYVTITVGDESDGIQYAIDSTEPDAFGDSGSFSVQSGSTHTIYAKDAEGNITAQQYSVSDEKQQEESPDEKTINIDVNLSDNGEYNVSAEDGGGTVYEKQKSSNTADSGKVFYTVTTKEGEVFYIVIDQNNNEDNVYLLDQVTVSDLQALANNNGYDFVVSERGQKSGSLLDALSSGNKESESEELTQDPENSSASAEGQSRGSNMSGTVMILIIGALAGGAYYFLHVKKNKANTSMDEIDNAHDLQDYEPEDDAEDEVHFAEADEPGAEDQIPEEDAYLMDIDTEKAFSDADEEFNEFNESEDDF